MEYNLAIGTNKDSWRKSLLAGLNKFTHIQLQTYENQNICHLNLQYLMSRDWRRLRTFLVCSCLQMLNSTNPSLTRTHDNNNKGLLLLKNENFLFIIKYNLWFSCADLLVQLWKNACTGNTNIYFILHFVIQCKLYCKKDTNLYETHLHCAFDKFNYKI